MIVVILLILAAIGAAVYLKSQSVKKGPSPPLPTPPPPPPPPPSEPPQQPSLPSPPSSATRRDAVCRTDFSIDDYTIDTSKSYKGSELLAALPSVTNPAVLTEHFVLTSNVVTDITQLDPNKMYFKGTRNTSATISPAANGGVGCTEFPAVVWMAAL